MVYDFTATDKVSAELKEKLLQVKGVSEVNISRQGLSARISGGL